MPSHLPECWDYDICGLTPYFIQDDEADWCFEAGQIAGVHQNAILTLGATAAASDEEGLFFVSRPEHEPVEFNSDTSAGQAYTVYVRQQICHALALLPLFERSKIYQERLLSNRFLHFAKDEIVWECKEDVGCECSPNMPPNACEEDDAYQIRRSLYASYHGEAEASYLEAFTASLDLVQINTQLKLSISRDK